MYINIYIYIYKSLNVCGSIKMDKYVKRTIPRFSFYYDYIEIGINIFYVDRTLQAFRRTVDQFVVALSVIYQREKERERDKETC